MAKRSRKMSEYKKVKNFKDAFSFENKKPSEWEEDVRRYLSNFIFYAATHQNGTDQIPDEFISPIVDMCIDVLGLRSEKSDENTKIAVEKIVSNNQEIAEQIRGGNIKAINVLVGKVMKENNRFSPALVRDMLSEMFI
jgi:hypothetical protein